MTDLTLGDAARAIGVSPDTLRRWTAPAGCGPCATIATAARPRSEVARLRAARSGRPGDGFGAQPLPGHRHVVEVDGVMGSSRSRPPSVAAAGTRDAVEGLGLAPASPRRPQ